MKFDELVIFLEKRLKEPKPGESAHLLMKPNLANGASYNLKPQKAPKEGAVLVLLNRNEKNGEAQFPLIQRPTYPGVHSGQIALPGGKREEKDASLFETAIRETEEEIGISGKKIEILGSLSPFYVAVSNFDVLPVVGMIENMPDFIPDQREVIEVFNPRVGELMNNANRKQKEMTVRNGINLLSPYFDLSGKTVWGATAMMLSEFKAILSDLHS